MMKEFESTTETEKCYLTSFGFRTEAKDHIVIFEYDNIPTGQGFWLTSSTYLPFDGLTKKLYEDISATQADYLMLYVANLRNIDDLLKFKPRGKTIVFWDFGDTMYIVHKDLSDRLWGDSGIRTFFQFVQYKLASVF
jgi:hypothetical protein